MERPFLRDCAFYLGAVYVVFWVFYHKSVHLGHAIGFIALYIVYVIVVIIGRIWNSRTSNAFVILCQRFRTDPTISRKLWPCGRIKLEIY